MSNIKYNTTLKKTGFTYNLYNTDIKLKATYGDFELPAWTVENFNSNSVWKARYLLSSYEDYTNLKEEQKEKLREEVFLSWAETIWSIIRQRIGLAVDLIGWDKLDKQQQENIKLALAQQINNWRINLPYEINNNVSRVSGNLQTTINASAFTIGFDILSQQTKQSITATGLDTYDYTELLEKCYREDSLLVEVKTNKERISLLEENKIENTLPENLLTRTEAANLYEKIGGGYITKTEADNLYLKSLNLNSLTSGGYFENESKVSDTSTTKSLKNTSSSRELKITTSADSLTYQFLNNNNIERTYNFDRGGLTIDNLPIPTTNSILSNIRSNYYDKTTIDTKVNDINSHLTSEDNKLKDDIRKEIATNYYNKQDSDTNFYTKPEIDTKITSAVTSGQVDLGNYNTKNEITTLLNSYLSLDETNLQELNSNIGLDTVIIRGNPVSNSNNSARMEDIISEVKRLFTAAVEEYDKTGKKEFTNIVKDEEFYTLESDDEEIIITIENQQKTIDATSITFSGILIFENTFYQRQTDGTDEKIDQKILLKKNGEGKLQFSFTRTETNIGNAGIGTIGTFIVVIDKVEIRKDSVRELVNSLQKIT